MIEDEVAREALALLGTTAAMLVEEAHGRLTSPPRTMDAAVELIATLELLGREVSALAGAAAVLRRRAGAFRQCSKEIGAGRPS